jgi:hypothetical protein
MRTERGLSVGLRGEAFYGASSVTAMFWSRISLAITALELVSASATHFLPEPTDKPVGEFELATDRGLPFLTDAQTPPDGLAEVDSEFHRQLANADSFNFHFASDHLLRRIDLSRNQHVMMSGAPGETVRLNLRDFMLADQSMVMLEGTATTNFIINVRKQFSLTGSSKVFLSGAVHWDNVAFQIAGRGTAVRLANRASLEGVIIARHRSVRLRGRSRLFGKVIAKHIRISDSARVVQPPIVSP